jgi:hypothetical protein
LTGWDETRPDPNHDYRIAKNSAGERFGGQERGYFRISYVVISDDDCKLSELRAVNLFDNDCFPTCHPDYRRWVYVEEPSCWCNPRQCGGDADGQAQGKQKNYWVSVWDLDVLVAAWNKPFEEIEGETITVGDKQVELICADFAHDAQGKQNYRVSTNDLDILVANWQQANVPAPTCLVDCQQEGAALPVKQHTLEEFVIWLEELWLSDDEVRRTIGNRRWNEFLESLIEEWLSE